MTYDFTKFKDKLKRGRKRKKRQQASLRTGQASPALLDGVKVDSYGSPVPISQIAGVTTEGARTLRITPWDSGQIKDIEKAVIVASLGVSVSVDDKGLRVNIPELSAERRTQILKIAKERLEDAKKTMRAHRDDVMKDLQAKEKAGGLGKDDVFRFKNDAQKIIDEGNKKLDEILSKKEKEILS